MPGSELAVRGSAFDGGAGEHILGERPSTSFEDMPFAVDLGPVGVGLGDAGPAGLGSVGPDGQPQLSPTGSSAAVGAASSSQVVTSLAHKCATAGRLKLFSSTMEDVAAGQGTVGTEVGNTTNTVSSLADQLAEFRTFGATLGANQTTSQGGGTIGTDGANAVPILSP
mmetsp:Transcript_13895/g.28566  ORF Transcript_13895/g.28566 Transcript_13895/m.28566 type:complete len:168 (+) Transcript_13895:1673-2176(+)